jgi:cysteine synthase B
MLVLANSNKKTMAYKTLQDTIGNTPLVQLVRLPGADAAARNNIILGKLEGNNPAGSVKDRAAMSMLKRAEERGDIKPGDTLIEATSGNTGIALAMAAAIRGYKMLLLMPENLSVERRQSMAAYGANIMLTPKTGGMEYARDMAEQLQKDGKGIILDQFANQDNARAHYEHRPGNLARHRRPRHPLRQRHGHHRHHHGRVALPEGTEPGVQIIGAEPEEGSSIPGIRKWPEAYLPKIYDRSRVDRVEVGVAGGGRTHGAPHGGGRRHLLRHLGSRCLRNCAAHFQDGGERHHRVHRLRPRRPLPVDRRFPGLRQRPRPW